MSDWSVRPLDEVYAAIFIDAIVVKVRDGQVANRPVYAAIGVSLDGERDILGLWAADPLAREAIAVARSSGNLEVLADVLAWHAQILVLQGSPDIAEEEALLAELATLPRATWHLRHGRQGWLDRIAAIVRLQVGDLAGFDAALQRVARLGDENQDRFLFAHVAMWRGLRALLDGRLNESKTTQPRCCDAGVTIPTLSSATEGCCSTCGGPRAGSKRSSPCSSPPPNKPPTSTSYA
jgi:Transposase, Mutator family